MKRIARKLNNMQDINQLNRPGTDFGEAEFKFLMQRRINKVLIICSNYDFFMLEEDGRIDEQIAGPGVKGPSTEGTKPARSVTWRAGPVCWACVAFVGAVRRRFVAGAGGRRKRRALGRSESLLGQARSRSGDEREARKLIATAIRVYLADRFSASAESITPPDAWRLLEADPRTDVVREPLCSLFERNFNASYGVLPRGILTVEQDVESALKVLSQLEGFMRANAGRREEEGIE